MTRLLGFSFFVLLSTALTSSTALAKSEANSKSKTTRPLAGKDRAELVKTLRVMEQVVSGTLPYKASGEASGQEAFSVENCQVPMPELLKVFLTGNSYTQNYKFAEGCDIEGSVVYSRSPFVVDLKTRNTGEVNRVTGLVDYKLRPMLQKGTLEMQPHFKNGRIYIDDTALAEFRASYKLTSDLAGNIVANDGGVVTITKFRNQPTTQTHTFKTEFE